MATLSALYSPDVVFHVSGRHPLSGDYLGLDSAFGYMLKVGEITEGRGGFEVETVLADDDTVVAVVTGIGVVKGHRVPPPNHARLPNREWSGP